jgi:hypothetical protein
MTYSEVDLERVVDEPLERLRCELASVLVRKMVFVLTVNVPIIAILTGSPFQRPLKPILPYILVIACPAPSPATEGGQYCNLHRLDGSLGTHLSCHC